MKRPEENYGLDGLPTEVEYLRSDRRWLVEENNTLRAALENIAKNSKGLIRRAATQALEGSGYRDRGRERSADTIRWRGEVMSIEMITWSCSKCGAIQTFPHNEQPLAFFKCIEATPNRTMCGGTWHPDSTNSGKPAPDDPNSPFRWICIHCDTVSGIDDKACLGCRKPRYPTLAAASGGTVDEA